MNDTTKTPGYLHLERTYEVNASWREMLGDAAFRAAIFDSGDDFEDIVEHFNECGTGDEPKATVDDLNDFLTPGIESLQRELAEKEQSKGWEDWDAIFFWRAAEDCDTECLLEHLEEKYPGFHFYVLENRPEG